MAIEQENAEGKKRGKGGKELVIYIPTLDGKAWVTSNTINHGGLYSQAEFKKAVEMLEYTAHNFRNPRLFHICFTGATLPIYKLARTRLCRALDAEGVRFRWKAALEMDSTKGDHYHLMIVLEAINQTHQYIRAGEEKSGDETESLLHEAVRKTWNECATLDYRVNPARSGLAFIQYNQTNMAKFNDAADWMSYVYKARSKSKGKMAFFSSREKKAKN